jgi:SecD/SecF fusion protein
VGVERAGARRIEVTLPDRATADRVKRALLVSGRLIVYDWEPNVIGEDGHRHPRDPAVTGGQAAGQPGAGTMPEDTARRIARRHVPAIAVQAQYDDSDAAAKAAARDAYFVLGGVPAMTGKDIAGAEAAADETTGDPVVTVDLTAAGRTAMRRLSRAVSRRGMAAMKENADAPAMASAGHFAFVLDGRVLSVPYIDPEQNPNGVDASNGVQVGGGGSFTRASAQELAALLSAGPLPATLRVVDERPA